MPRRFSKILLLIFFFVCQLLVEIGSGMMAIMILWAVFGRNVPPSTFLDYVSYLAVAIGVFIAAVFSWHTTSRKWEKYTRRRL